MTTTSLLPDLGTELREGYAEVGDVRLHYVEAGEGPLIVLLHGFPEFWFGWRLQIAPLAAAGFRVVAPDTRGYNLSSKPESFEAYAVDLLVADIRGFIGELGAELRCWSVTTGADRSPGPSRLITRRLSTGSPSSTRPIRGGSQRG